MSETKAEQLCRCISCGAEYFQELYVCPECGGSVRAMFSCSGAASDHAAEIHTLKMTIEQLKIERNRSQFEARKAASAEIIGLQRKLHEAAVLLKAISIDRNGKLYANEYYTREWIDQRDEIAKTNKSEQAAK